MPESVDRPAPVRATSGRAARTSRAVSSASAADRTGEVTTVPAYGRGPMRVLPTDAPINAPINAAAQPGGSVRRLRGDRVRAGRPGTAMPSLPWRGPGKRQPESDGGRVR